MNVRNNMALRRFRKSFSELADDERALVEATVSRPIRSVDGQTLVQGTRVFTNNLDRGTVDLTNLDYEWHTGEKRWVPWFDVILDTDYKGQPKTGTEMQSDDRVATRFEGKNA